jgi:putative ABC transport system permease protein
MRSLFEDLRYSLRQLRKMPGFAATAILSLALGIGATTSVFSVVYGILLNPYPYRAPDRMAHLRLLTPKNEPGNFVGLTPSQWLDLKKSPVLEDAFIAGTMSETVTGSDLPEDVEVASGSSNMFEFLGVPPVLGRGLEPSDAITGQDPQPVAVLSYNFWQRHFSADPHVLGKTIELSHKAYTIVGVAASRFTWVDGDIYVPLKIDGEQLYDYFPEMRLKPGITHAQADAALQPLFEQWVRETPKHFPPDQVRLHIEGLNEHFVRDLGGTLYLLFSAVALLLLIGCGNVSILLLARATARQHEFAVRAAIGASRRRIVRQLLVESLLLSVTGAAIGVLLAYGSLHAIVANLPSGLFPHEAAIQINLAVLGFTVVMALGTGLLFGLWPAFQLARTEPSQALQSGTRKVAGRVGGRRAHAALIAGQLALTLLMLTGAGAAISGFLHLVNTPLGYDPHNVMSVGIALHQGAYNSWAERAAYIDRLRTAIDQVPGVAMTAISTNATPPANGFSTKFEILGKPSAHEQTLRLNLVSSQYFPLLRIPLAQGRIWDEAEDHRGAPVAVINETLARRYFPSGDAVGHSIQLPGLPIQPPLVLTAPGVAGWIQIVGVVADKLDDGLSAPIQPELFVPDTLILLTGTQVLVRSEASPLTLLHAIGKAVSEVNRDQQIAPNSRDLEQWIHQMPEWARGHLISWLFSAYAALALALAAVGLYSVVSYTVVQRTNEFGIRIALGAPRRHVLGIVFQSMAASVTAGIVAGLLLAVALNRVMARWDVESARNPLLLLVAISALSFVAVLACALPARRAAGVDPMSAIRYE